MRPIRPSENSHHSHDANNSNAPKNVLNTGRRFQKHLGSYKRVGTFLAAFVVAATLTAVFFYRSSQAVTPLLIEDFNYTAATGYPSSGIGNAVSMTTSGWDDKPDEQFSFNIAFPTNANISFNQRIGTITNEDVACVTPTTVYVDDSWVGTPLGSDPDGAGPATNFGCDSFATIQDGVNGVASGGNVIVRAGTYAEAVLINKPVTLLGAQAGQNANTRFAAFTGGVNGPKADPAVESIITAAATAPASGANDTLHVMGSNVTIDGFVVDGNNPALAQGGATVIGGINTDSRRAIQTEDAAGNAFPANNVTARFNVIQNFSQRGVELINGTSSGTAPATSGSLVTANLIRNFGLDGIVLAFNAHADITFNTVVTNDYPTEAGIWVQDFLNTGTPHAINITDNNVTVGQDNFGGIWANLAYLPAININNNTVNAAASVTSGSDFTYGIYVTSLRPGSNASLNGNTVGASGGTFDRGIALWNLGTGQTTTVTGGTVGHSVDGVSLHDNDPNFGLAGSNSAVDLSGVNISGPISGTSVGVLIDALGSTGDTVAMQISGNTSVSGCSTGISVLGANASANIHNNAASIHDNGVGINVAAGSATIISNNLYTNGTGLRFTSGASATAHFNRIISTTTAIDNANNLTLNLENNWWGCNAGPGNAGCGAVTGTGADFDPWIVLGVSASPSSIPPFGNSTITADMTKNSAGATPVGTLPDMAVAFSATNGTMAPPAGTITAGSASSSFTSTSTSSGTACATVDNQNICANITVVLPSFSINDVTHLEGNPLGTTSYTFTITKTGTTAFNTSVDYETVDGSATAPSDFTAIPPATVVFLPTDTTMQVTVLVKRDYAVESDEAFTVHLSNPINATISDADGTGTIQNDEVLPNTVYVDPAFTGPVGSDPDGVGPATAIGYDAFATIQEGINGVAPAGTVNVQAGTYDEDVAINNGGLKLLGAGAGSTNIRGPIGGDSATVHVLASNVTIAGFTITRLGNNPTDWDNSGLNSAGIAIQGTGITGTLVRDNIITGNRTGIDVNNSSGHTIRNNVIDFNRTGMVFRNQTDNMTVVENFVTNNWTVGILFLDASSGSNVPVQSALSSIVSNNNLSANWYGQIVDRQTGGSLPAPGTTNLKNFRGDWFGTTSPVVTTANSAEPGYAAQIPVAYGGTATPPGGQPDIAGSASANFKYIPFLQSGTDTNVETTPGRGTFGFQGVESPTIVVRSSSLQGWTQQHSTCGAPGTGSQEFVVGPPPPPLGEGSLRYLIGSNGDSFETVRTPDFQGAHLDALTRLSYVTYAAGGGSGGQAPYLLLNIDNNNDGALDDQLFFEPVYQNGTYSMIFPGDSVPNQCGANPSCVSTGQWQTWNALVGGWWSVNESAGGPPLITLARYAVEHPDARIVNTPAGAGGFRIATGCGGAAWVNFDGNVDDLIVGVSGANTRYDFEPLPRLSIDDVTHIEGSGGTTSYTFNVTMSSASDQTVTVDYATADDSATAPSDYNAIPATPLTFNPGETSKPVTVQVIGDTTFEVNEQFFVNLSNVNSNATILDSQGVGAITDDDTAPSFSINNVTLAEGNSGTTAFTFTVTKTGATQLPATVDFATANGATNPATGGTCGSAAVDYASQTGTLNFAANETTKPITIQVCGDVTYEANEKFTVTLSNPTQASVSPTLGTGTGTINNDDAAPTLSINDVSMAEGNSGTTDFAFTVTKAGNSTELPVTVNFSTVNGGINGATGGATCGAGIDYESQSGTLTFQPNETTMTIHVNVCGDPNYENNEFFFVNLLSPTNATIIRNPGTGAIQNDDATPTVSIDDVTMLEGNSGTTSFVFTVTKTGASEFTTTVHAKTINHPSGQASAPSDFTAIVDQTLTFPPSGTTDTQTVTVLVNGDTLYEADELFFVSLSNATNAQIIVFNGTGTIQNDDTAPTLSIDNVTMLEGNSGPTSFTFTITKTGTTEVNATVRVDTANNTASAPGDYTAITNQTVTFLPADTSKQVTVTVNGDTNPEGDETFFVNLSSPTNASILTGQGTGTIQNDDTCPTAFMVNDTGDAGDVNPGDGLCATSLGACTLRAAIEEANALTVCGTIDINFSIGGSTVTVGSVLAITHSVNINGPTSPGVTVSGTNASPTRVFHVTAGTVSMTNLTVTGARIGSGGGLFVQGATVTISNMLFTDNAVVNGSGGGAGVTSGTLNIRNSTFSNNTATNGGGLYNGGGTLNLVNVTVTNNNASGDTGSGACGVNSEGGGLDNLGANPTFVRNSIIAGNTACNPAVPNVSGPITDQGNNILSGDPLLAALLNNGGPTLTHALLYNSPGIDAGNDCVLTNACVPPIGVALTTDQRGLPRQADSDANGIAKVDIGAYERQATETRDVPSVPNTRVDLADVRLNFPIVSPTPNKTASLSIIPPSQYPTLGTPPTGYTVVGPAFDVTNNFGHTGPVDVCFYLPSLSTSALANLKVLHQVGGNLVDHGSFVNFAGKMVCTHSPSFSNYVIGQNAAPTAAPGIVSGRILDANGAPVEGAAVRITGTQNRLAVTDSEGNYRFENVEASGFYTVIPSRTNYMFSPEQRSFSQVGERTDAVFTASANGNSLNPLDATVFFVRQQYLDFLGREPDEAGLNFWVNNIEACGADNSCRTAKLTDTSAAFFISIEFQQTGYLVHRMYQSAYGDIPGAPAPVRLGEFRPDTQVIGRGVVVNQNGWEAKLEANKQAFASQFVQRGRFTSAYPTTMTPTEFVDRLFLNAGVTPESNDRAAAINEFVGVADTADAAARARALRRVAENATLRQQEFNQAFVLMQYFGYLRRDPNTGPDADFSGYDFWLNKLDSFNGDFRRAEMVRAFLVAGEYRGRFPR